MKRMYSMSILLLWLGVSSVLLAQSQLVFTEIMYNPAESGSDSTEYLEIYNNSETSIDLMDFYISSGIVFTFPNISIAAQEFIIISSDSLAMVNTYGFEGSYEWSSGSLSNSGESIAIKNADGVLLDSLKYDDNAAWPDEADQGGSSLVLCDPNSDNILSENWTISTLSAGITVNSLEVFGSPGIADPGCVCESFSEVMMEACDSYSSPSGNYTWTESGTYNDTILNVAECDSIITFDLIINESKSYTDEVQACISYEWIDEVIYTESNNTAFVVLTSNAGCDSTIYLDLTISETIEVVDHINACGPITWIDGVEYTENNSSASMTYMSNNGCDSIITLNLVINSPSESLAIHETCESFEWIDGITYTESNNTATFTLENEAGCDSIISLDLTILEGSAYTDVQEACESYEWIDGNMYTESNNTATFTLENEAGCDSIITLDLIILENSSYVDIQETCESYEWIDGNTYTESNNTATFTLENEAGCDSVITLDLTILESSAYTDVQEACESYEWIDGNMYTESNNIATITLENHVGCDSIITLNLTINTVDVSLTVSGNTITSNLEDAAYQWIDCDDDYSIIEGEYEQSFTAVSNGNFAVIVTENNCRDTSECVNITGIGIDENTKEQILKIYPNPASDEVYIQLSETLNFEVSIFNIDGKEMIYQQSEDKGQIKLSIKELDSGIYFIKIKTGENLMIKKFVKP